MSKKIAFVSPFFYPEPISTGKYNTLLAKAIAENGNNLDVFCSHPLYPDWKVTKSNAQLKNMNIIRGGANNWYSSNKFLRRVILELWFAIFIFINIRKFQSDYKSIVFIMPPSLALFVLRLLKLKIPIICIVHDLQVVLMKTKSTKVRNIASKIISSIEKMSLRAATDIIYLSNEMKQSATETYNLSNTPASVFYPFITIDDFTNNETLSSIIKENEINIVYSGALGEKQSPKNLIEFLDNYAEQRKNINVFVFSRGPYFEELKAKHSNVLFYDLVPEEALPELLLKSSVQIIPQEGGASGGSLPSKLPNILAAGCKVFCITDPGSELSNAITQTNSGSVVYSWDMKVLIQEMDKLVSYLGEKNDSCDLTPFKIETLVQHIVNL